MGRLVKVANPCDSVVHPAYHSKFILCQTHHAVPLDRCRGPCYIHRVASAQIDIPISWGKVCWNCYYSYCFDSAATATVVCAPFAALSSQRCWLGSGPRSLPAQLSLLLLRDICLNEHALERERRTGGRRERERESGGGGGAVSTLYLERHEWKGCGSPECFHFDLFYPLSIFLTSSS